MTEKENTMTLEEAKAKIAELERKIAEYEEPRKLSNMATKHRTRGGNF